MSQLFNFNTCVCPRIDAKKNVQYFGPSVFWAVPKATAYLINIGCLTQIEPGYAGHSNIEYVSNFLP